MSEVEFKGVHYRIGTLDAFKQFHVARRLAPLMAQMAKAAEGVPQSADGTEDEKAARWFASIAGPLAEAFAGMSDETADYIIQTCLMAVSRDAGKGTWAPVLSRQKALMYQDIDMGTMVQLTMAVVQENLAGFFSTALANSSEAAAASS